MNNLIEKIKNIETSKKLLFIVTFVWVATLTVNYVSAYQGIESNTINQTFNLVNNAFIIELGYYGFKSGAENITKIKNNSKINETINKAIEKIDEVF